MAPSPPVLLELTRTIRRAGGRPSGIDRVEIAYLDHLLSQRGREVWGIVRRQIGNTLLRPGAVRGIADRVHGRTPWEPGERPKDRGRAAARALGGIFVTDGLLGLFARARLRGGTFLGLSQTGLEARRLGALRRAGMRVVGMVHDTIPLDAPQYQRAVSPGRFEAMLEGLSRHADLILYNSRASEAAARPHLARLGRVPGGLVAHLGVEPPAPAPSEVEGGMPPAPYFLALGTIEPRKNLAFLLDLWPDVPGTLVIAGRRGWMEEALFARLDAGLPRVREIREPSDGAVGALIAGAAGLLMPSHVEGFGLPPAEAAAMGVRALCNDLPVYREFLGANAVYASVTDPYQWKTTIRKWAAEPGGVPPARMPTWAEHFGTVAPHL